MFILAHAKDEKITVCIAVLALLSYCVMQWEFILHWEQVSFFMQGLHASYEEEKAIYL